MRRLVVILICVLSLAAMSTEARRRSSEDVRRDRDRAEQQISQTEEKISKNADETRRQLNRLNSIKATLEQRADTIRQLNQKIVEANNAIALISDSLVLLDDNLAKLRRSYGATLRSMRTRRQGVSDLAFVFSAETFSQAWRRLNYMGEVADASAERAKNIKHTMDGLERSRQRLAAAKETLQTSLAQLQATQNMLNEERADANILVKSLRRKGGDLNRELERRRRQADDLNSELERIVDQEIAEAVERERLRKAEEERLRKEAEECQRKEAEARRKQEQQDTAKALAPTPAPEPAPKPQPAPEPAPDPEPPPTPRLAPQPERDYAAEAEAERRLTGSFQANKGKLLFPVAGRYTITTHFGTNEHPELSKVKYQSLGIDIEVPAGTQARAVFEGVVSTIFRQKEYHNVVIVRHGEYLTVYAGIDVLSVKKGDKVATGQSLGEIFTDPHDDNRTMLHFEIRREKHKLDPELWVK